MSSVERFRGFKSHPHLEGSHAVLSPSNYHWLRYTEDKLIERLHTLEAAERGTRLHAWASEAIKLGRYQPRDGDILCAYINDALDLGLVPEQLLFYSPWCYGTADTIGFDPEEQFLQIHDYKSGTSRSSVDQLYVYAALFCLEYEYRPFEINGRLRIYQGEEIREYEIDQGYLASVCDTIVSFDEVVTRYRSGKRGGLL